jgi:hypothetical protein
MVVFGKCRSPEYNSHSTQIVTCRQLLLGAYLAALLTHFIPDGRMKEGCSMQ